ncbi:MAG: ComF family protein [Cytophagales bacterium]|nr:ComF family protein [Cytophagales bacterium]
MDFRLPGRRCLFSEFLDLLFPPHCIGCEERVYEPTYLCPRCSCDLENHRVNEEDLKRLKDKNLFLFPDEKLYVLAPFWDEDEEETGVRRCIHLMKYQGRHDIARMLGKACGSFLPSLNDNSDMLMCPVPLHFYKKIQRGFNQSYEICRGIQEVFPIPIVPILRRVKHTGPQVGANWEVRDKQLQGAFELDPSCPSLLGKNCLLVDDVLTTGSTLSECTSLLHQAKARVHILVVAAVIGSKKKPSKCTWVS